MKQSIILKRNFLTIIEVSECFTHLINQNEMLQSHILNEISYQRTLKNKLSA
jgi:hypothetical protein